MGGREEDVERRHSAAVEEPPQRLGEDRFYRAMAATQRRRLLYYLLETTESTVGELVSVLGGWEVATTGTMQRPADRTALRLRLVHVHLPRLADAGLVEYDPEEGSVRLEQLHPQVTALVRRSVEAGAVETG